MNQYKIISLTFLLVAFFRPAMIQGETEKIFSDSTGASPAHETFLLDNGRIYREEKSRHALPIGGDVLGINCYDNTLYFIRQSGEGWLAGSFRNPEGETSEFSLGTGFSRFIKLAGHDNIFYFLADFNSAINSENTENSADVPVKTERVLVRFDPNKNERKIIRGVYDFALSDNGLILLTPSGLNYNGVLIPLMVQRERYIDRIIDGRFVFLTNGEEIEVIDIISERNIYIYREGKAFPHNPDYNIMLQFNDTARPEDSVSDIDTMIYYQVNVNGVEYGRTETAPSNVVSSSMIKAETGKYCIIKPERWELDRIKGRYIRVNNIYQPEEFKLYVPDNRIIKIRFDFDGEKYIVNQSVYEN
jgi:hypothetical protein